MLGRGHELLAEARLGVPGTVGWVGYADRQQK